jgi:RNA polymerase sigma-70 factor, ECF subfamily
VTANSSEREASLHAATATIEMPVEAAIPTLAGEPADLEQLFRNHHGLVFRTAYRITGNAGDAEDVLQTVFLRLAGRDPSAKPLANPEHYLRRAAVNAALDIVRSRHAEDTAPVSDLPQADPAQADRSELQECLRRALARLSPEAAEVFALRFLEGHNNREIAEMLGASQVWVAVTVYRARRRLQEAIRSYFGGKS